MNTFGLLAPVVLIIIIILLINFAGKNSRPVTPSEEYFYRGCPNKCIQCGTELTKKRYPFGHGKVKVVIRCPRGHESYSWLEDYNDRDL